MTAVTTRGTTADQLLARWLGAERRHADQLTALLELGPLPAHEMTSLLHRVDEARAADEARDALRDHDAGLR